MTRVYHNWQALAVLVLVASSALSLPLMSGLPSGGSTAIIMISLIAGALAAMATQLSLPRLAVLAVAPHLAAWLLLAQAGQAPGQATASFWVLLAASWLLAWRLASSLSAIKARTRGVDLALRLIIPTLFGVWILLLWEAIVIGAGIPFVLLPPPSAVAARFANSLPVLAADVNQTIFKSVLIGYVLGCSTGFLAAIVADRFVFIRRGLLPVGNMVSALPIIGIAPIMVMWFGFDWHSKAAVVVVMTFFPMLVNTGAGLAADGHMERDLMRTYASGYWQTLAKLRLPAAMPFIFNALKINSTLALIGAIVAEFFGTPVVGMGFRISTEVGRMNVDMVWAEIAVAALAGSVFYGVIALAERAITFWHPSVRGG
ncbi:ABC transporter permease [Aerobium aerolatum]|uniref:NitT/TauT family transport system permease protein n=1 Tax=Aquamicrobium aerolatum DSM 21857 TaxID=1121003 RepID=A0A1I3QHI7_9HYPH|nr:ABC transporter permease [Aquamicrobium aerolatum]SFJ32992.1 NitT/TauT family transport system permease protein [Aquamicrobium aerolatum DSM 21857]